MIQRTGLILCMWMMLYSQSAPAQKVQVKEAYARVLLKLTRPLLGMQVKDTLSRDCGALTCERCGVLHTRAAEAMYPFYISWQITGEHAFETAAKQSASWLFRQQQPNGSWKETPEEWTGTTTDQLLMLLLTYEGMQNRLTLQEQEAWRRSMQKAAGYLFSVMTPEFASINYVATTTATLAKAGAILHDNRYTARARSLARRVLAKFDSEGFLNGEGGKSHGNKMGVDLGYNMEMSLWGLGLYARVTGDSMVNNMVKKALKQHVNFIYPDGSLDASWGIRSNKWTGYGSGTSDGCQVLFSLYAEEDPIYISASLRNLSFLEKNITRNGLPGYGPMHDQIFDSAACIYPGFTKAKNIAMAYALETRTTRNLVPIPSDSIHRLHVFPTVDVMLVRTANMMATVTAYRYKDQQAGSRGKYMFRPAGGAISHIWLKGWGFLQASSPTVYTRPEPMSFPEAPGVLPLTPRIEYTDTAGYFTNLFEFDAHSSAVEENERFVIRADGELKDRNWLTGGVGYNMQYIFSDSGYEKNIALRYHDAWPSINIIEPFIQDTGTRFAQTDAHTILITRNHTRIRFELLSNQAELSVGKEAQRYWAPYPALRAMPVLIYVPAQKDRYDMVVRYRIRIEKIGTDHER